MKVEIGQFWRFKGNSKSERWQKPWSNFKDIKYKILLNEDIVFLGNTGARPYMRINNLLQPNNPDVWEFGGWACEFCHNLCNQSCYKIIKQKSPIAFVLDPM